MGCCASVNATNPNSQYAVGQPEPVAQPDKNDSAVADAIDPAHASEAQVTSNTPDPELPLPPLNRQWHSLPLKEGDGCADGEASTDAAFPEESLQSAYERSSSWIEEQSHYAEVMRCTISQFGEASIQSFDAASFVTVFVEALHLQQPTLKTAGVEVTVADSKPSLLNDFQLYLTLHVSSPEVSLTRVVTAPKLEDSIIGGYKVQGIHFRERMKKC